MEKIRKELEIIADENYRIFSSKLIPNINNVLGVNPDSDAILSTRK